MDFSNTFFLVMFGCGLLFALVALGFMVREAFSRGGGEIGGWELRGATRRIAAVARTTLAEGLRAKVASGFALVMLISIPVFWHNAEGDGTVKGQLQMFITYSLGLAAFLLSLMTILFACRSLSVEIASRQIYAVATKPIPRWQILAGKWVGVMSLNVLLLAAAVVMTGVGTRLLVSRFKADLRHELTTYGKFKPGEAERAAAALDRVRGVGKPGPESPVVYAMAEAVGRTPQEIVEAMILLPEPTRINLRRFDEVRRQVLTARYAAQMPPPNLDEEVEREYARLREQEALPEGWSDRQIRKQLDRELFTSYATVPFGVSKTWVLQGAAVQADADFLMSVRFKLEVAAQLPPFPLPGGGQIEEDTVLCAWGVGDPTKPTHYVLVDAFPVRAMREFEIPVNCVEPDGTIRIEFANLDPRQVDIIFDLPKALEVLYRVGSFEGNLFRGFLAILIELACLTSFGVLASTFLSFPSGSAMLIILYVIMISMPFVLESLALTEDYTPANMQDLKFFLRKYTIDGLNWVISVGDCDPVEKLGDGRAIGWGVLGANFAKYVVLKSGVVMLAALAVLRRRELAAVIV